MLPQHLLSSRCLLGFLGIILGVITTTTLLVSSCVSLEEESTEIATPRPTQAIQPTPTETPIPTESPVPTEQPVPIESPEPTEQSTPTEIPTEIPEPTESPTATPTPTAQASATPAGDQLISLGELLERITVSAEVAEGYDRDDWKHWTDEDRDGQDTRQEVLAAESLAATVVANGRIREGRWQSIYDGQEITVAGDLDVDHVVALAEAHQSGGWAWNALTKELYANDLRTADHLIAVSKGSNRSKGARDPAEWLPPDRNSLCQYLIWWTTIKVRWNLSMDQAEYNTILNEANSTCSNVRIDPDNL